MSGTSLAVQAVEAQLDAFRLMRLLVEKAHTSRADFLNSRYQMFSEFGKEWRADFAMVALATPFGWSGETIKATLSASQSVPLDTSFNRFNIDKDIVWWYFEEPLPFQTIDAENAYVQALSFGRTRSGARATCWLRDPRGYEKIMPSQTFTWHASESLGELLDLARKEHRRIYGPGGIHEKSEQVGEDVFMRATEGVARFILAGMAWVNQRVLLPEPAHVERHRRKEYQRTIGRESAVKIVSLRRRVHQSITVTREPGSEEIKREYSCQWVVDGHWRNQACGPKMGERKLTWVMPYVKGPEDKPLKEKPTIYVVDR